MCGCVGVGGGVCVGGCGGVCEGVWGHYMISFWYTEFW